MARHGVKRVTRSPIVIIVKTIFTPPRTRRPKASLAEFKGQRTVRVSDSRNDALTYPRAAKHTRITPARVAARERIKRHTVLEAYGYSIVLSPQDPSTWDQTFKRSNRLKTDPDVAAEPQKLLTSSYHKAGLLKQEGSSRTT